MSNITSTINDISVVQSTISPSSLIGTYTQYEGSGTLSALADIDLQGVTDGSILVYDTNEFVARTLSGDATINSDGVLTLKPNFVTLGTNTSGAYVSTLTGTPDQITVLGSGGETANVTLSLPQSIATSSSPTFNNITLSGIIDNTDLTSKLALKAPLASPSFTGTPTAPEPSTNSNGTQIATTAFVISKVTAEVAAANAPTKTGGGATGNWGISITGTATTASTVVSGAIVPTSLTTAASTWNFKDKVGVNVASPSFQFEVTDTLASRSVGIGQSEIKFRGDGLTHWSIYGSRTSKDYFDIQNTSNAVTPGVDGTSCLRITKDGNIGIGVPTPTRKLEVNGSVVATSFIGNVSGNVSGSSGSCTGNAATVTNGVYTNAANVITGSLGFGSHGTNTISNGTGDQATLSTYNLAIKSHWGIGFPSYDNVNRIVLDTRTGGAQFSGTITAPTFSGNATTVTNGVYTSGDQVINGTKTFSNVIRLADAGIMFNSDGAQDTGFTWASDGIFNVRCNAVTVGTFRSTGWNGPVVGNVTGNVTGSSGSCTGNAATATNATNATNAGYATTAGYANDYPNRYFIPQFQVWTVNETGYWGNSFYTNGNNAYIDISINNLAATGFLYNGSNYAIFVELKGYDGVLFAQAGWYPSGNTTGRVRLISNLNLSDRIASPWRTGFHIQIRDHHSGKMGAIHGVEFNFTGGNSKENYYSF